MIRYAVMKNVGGKPMQIGVVLANNISHATTKAFHLFRRNIWVERLI